MGLLHGVRRALLGGGGIRWLLRDDFQDTRAAGAVNGTPATPGPGTRVVVDTDGDALSITGGQAVFANPNNVHGDPGLWYEAVTRIAGRMLLVSLVTGDVTNQAYAGFDTDQASYPFENWLSYGSDNLYASYQGTGPIVATSLDSTPYRLAIVLRTIGAAFFMRVGGNWILLWWGAQGSTATLYPELGIKDATLSADWIRIPDALWLPTPLAYDTFTRANSDTLGNTEIVGPDAQGVQPRAWTTIGGDLDIVGNVVVGGDAQSELITDGDMEADPTNNWLAGVATLAEEAVIVHGGAKSLKVTATGGAAHARQSISGLTATKLYYLSAWVTNDVGDDVSARLYDISNSAVLYWPANVDRSAGWHHEQVIFAAPTGCTGVIAYIYAQTDTHVVYGDDFSLLECHAEYIDPSQADVVFRANVTMPASGTDPGGLIVRRSGATQWLVQITPGTAGTDLELIELDDGAPTSRGTADVDPTAATEYSVVVITDGQTIDVFFDNTREIHYTSASVGETNTQFGIWDSADGNFSFDDVTIFPRGSDGEYSRLDKWSS